MYHSYAKFLSKDFIGQSTESWPKTQKVLDDMADQIAIMQHHDAITGTHDLFVSHQYNYDMDRVFKKGSELY